MNASKSTRGTKAPKSFLDYTKSAFYIIMHPGSVSDTYGVGDALIFYYKASILPAILAAIVGGLLGYAFGSLAFSGLATLSKGIALLHLAAPVLALMAAVYGLAYVLIFIPIGIVINAAVYQFFAKILFKIWKKDISRTLTAIMYSALPIALFFWLSFIPVIGLIVIMALAVWEFIILIISLARQQGISGWRAFGGILVSGVVLAIIIFVIDFALLYAATPTLYSVSPTCIQNSGFLCTQTSYSNGVFRAGIGQAITAKMLNARVFYVPNGTSFSSSDPSYYVGTLQSLQLANISIYVGSKALDGNLTIEYDTVVGQTTPYVKTLGSVYSQG
ncbi:MAG: hypothetical protein M1125_03250 [Candidatus Marsarchaeota archaeon]|nr:hypothetical protein [Candidatus Marsarchaeota archaeon]